MSDQLDYFEGAPLSQDDKTYFNPEVYQAINQITEELDGYDNHILTQLQKRVNGVTKTLNKLDAQTGFNTGVVSQPLAVTKTADGLFHLTKLCNKPPPAPYIQYVPYYVAQHNDCWAWHIVTPTQAIMDQVIGLCQECFINDPNDPPLNPDGPCTVDSQECCNYLGNPDSPGYNPEAYAELHARYGCGAIVDPPITDPNNPSVDPPIVDPPYIDRRCPPPYEKPCPPCPKPPPDDKDCCTVINKVTCPPPVIQNKVEMKDINLNIDSEHPININQPPINFSPNITVQPAKVQNEITIKFDRDEQDEKTCIEQAKTDEEKEECKTKLPRNHLEWLVSEDGQAALEKYMTEYGIPIPSSTNGNQFGVLKGIEQFRKVKLTGPPLNNLSGLV